MGALVKNIYLKLAPCNIATKKAKQAELIIKANDTTVKRSRRQNMMLLDSIQVLQREIRSDEGELKLVIEKY